MINKLYLLTFLTITISLQTEARKVITLSRPEIQEQQELKQLIEKLYADKNISGFSIDGNESKAITDVGGAPTYGEILWDSMATIFNDLKITSQDVFYDLGSGVGKATIQAYLTTPVKKSAGVELSVTRHNHAVTIADELKKLGYVKHPRTLEFYNKNIAELSLDDATLVFMCSTCFSDKLMHDIVKQLQNAKRGLRILTLRQLPRNPNFILEKTYNVPMTWSTSTPVYLYRKMS